MSKCIELTSYLESQAKVSPAQEMRDLARERWSQVFSQGPGAFRWPACALIRGGVQMCFVFS